MLQEIQQQGESEAQTRRGGAGSNTERRPPATVTSSKRVSASSGKPVSSPAPSSSISSYSKSLLVAIGSLQQRAETHRLGQDLRDEQESKTVSSSCNNERAPVGSRESGEAWWLPTSNSASQLVGRRDQADLTPYSFSDGTISEQAAALGMSTPVVLDTRSTEESNTSTLAYVAHDRHHDSRLIDMALFTKPEKIIEQLKARAEQRHAPKHKHKPRIVEDSRDYINAKHDSPVNIDKLTHPYTHQVMDLHLTSQASSSATVQSKHGRSSPRFERPSKRSKRHGHARMSPEASRFSSSDVLPESPGSITANWQRPARASESMVSSELTRPTSAPGVTRSPSVEEACSARRNSAPCENTSKPSRSMAASMHEYAQTMPSFQSEEHYFDSFAAHGQKDFTPSITPDSARAPVPLGDRPDRRDFIPLLAPADVKRQPTPPQRRGSCRERLKAWWKKRHSQRAEH